MCRRCSQCLDGSACRPRFPVRFPASLVRVVCPGRLSGSLCGSVCPDLRPHPVVLSPLHEVAARCRGDVAPRDDRDLHVEPVDQRSDHGSGARCADGDPECGPARSRPGDERHRHCHRGRQLQRPACRCRQPLSDRRSDPRDPRPRAHRRDRGARARGRRPGVHGMVDPLEPSGRAHPGLARCRLGLPDGGHCAAACADRCAVGTRPGCDRRCRAGGARSDDGVVAWRTGGRCALVRRAVRHHPAGQRRADRARRCDRWHRDPDEHGDGGLPRAGRRGPSAVLRQLRSSSARQRARGQRAARQSCDRRGPLLGPAQPGQHAQPRSDQGRDG